MKAAQLAPDAVLLPTDFDAYRKYSRLFKAAVRAIAPQIQDNGIDEIYIDLTEARPAGDPVRRTRAAGRSLDARRRGRAGDQGRRARGHRTFVLDRRRAQQAAGEDGVGARQAGRVDDPSARRSRAPDLAAAGAQDQRHRPQVERATGGARHPHDRRARGCRSGMARRALRPRAWRVDARCCARSRRPGAGHGERAEIDQPRDDVRARSLRDARPRAAVGDLHRALRGGERRPQAQGLRGQDHRLEAALRQLQDGDARSDPRTADRRCAGDPAGGRGVPEARHRSTGASACWACASARCVPPTPSDPSRAPSSRTARFRCSTNRRTLAANPPVARGEARPAERCDQNAPPAALRPSRRDAAPRAAAASRSWPCRSCSPVSRRRWRRGRRSSSTRPRTTRRQRRDCCCPVSPGCTGPASRPALGCVLHFASQLCLAPSGDSSACRAMVCSQHAATKSIFSLAGRFRLPAATARRAIVGHSSCTVVTSGWFGGDPGCRPGLAAQPGRADVEHGDALRAADHRAPGPAWRAAEDRDGSRRRTAIDAGVRKQLDHRRQVDRALVAVEPGRRVRHQRFLACCSAPRWAARRRWSRMRRACARRARPAPGATGTS